MKERKRERKKNCSEDEKEMGSINNVKTTFIKDINCEIGW